MHPDFPSAGTQLPARRLRRARFPARSGKEEEGVSGLVLIPDLEVEVGIPAAVALAEEGDPVPLLDLGLLADGSDSQMGIDRCIMILVLDDNRLSIILEGSGKDHRPACRCLYSRPLAAGDPDAVEIHPVRLDAKPAD